MSENSEDDEMLTALMSKFKGKPQELERAVRLELRSTISHWPIKLFIIV
jgi:hypothetical protein